MVGFGWEKNHGEINDRANFPIHHGIIKYWDEFESFMQYIFEKEYQVDSKDQKVLLSESPYNSNDNRNRLNEIMFEKFNLDQLNVTPTHRLTLYATGNTTGTVVECGGGISYSIPVFEDLVNGGQIEMIPSYNLGFGGHHLTRYLKSLLLNDSASSNVDIPYEYAREIKEKIGYVSNHFKEEMNSPPEFHSYQLPDGNTIEIGSERFCCAEPLFHPLLINYNNMGIHKIVYDSILKCGETFQKPLFEKIILGGGTSLFKGFTTRLNNELQNLISATPASPFSNSVKIIAPENRGLASWLGGSIKASSDSIFQSNLITKKQYEERGHIHTSNLYVQQ
ncbi:hypothetical protein DICPUDRAFT_95143 [Dictyostelium purpureum]|uniref:Actin n=1 Tax=Dictyostelium purpureum TaxID=5786 RepID=F0ZSR5_DICPU|nr:uncharacterized protein DICPUDRAFT_95143 [Dictyostelium purpureum]EGC33024.1 hypothetical protein DICPUDRAFT_95143 [Dictyostelium purpureum]|eukprot:XP_003290451.1 hypothetical protein DICPUDRAFT_95143 [Dictyostelium purpureum]